MDRDVLMKGESTNGYVSKKVDICKFVWVFVS